MDGVVTMPYDENAAICGIACQTCGKELSLGRVKFSICDDCLKALREIIKEKRKNERHSF